MQGLILALKILVCSEGLPKPSGAKNPRESRRGERSEHAGLSRSFSVNAVSEFSVLIIILNSETLDEIPKEFLTCLHE